LLLSVRSFHSNTKDISFYRPFLVVEFKINATKKWNKNGTSVAMSKWKLFFIIRISENGYGGDDTELLKKKTQL
jgi:hypothetical protein